MTERELLREQWRVVAISLEIEFVEPFFLHLANNQQYEFVGHFPQFGGERGMLIDAMYVPEAFSAAIVLGFSCSSMLAEAHYLPVDPSNYVDCLVDCGWSAKDRPSPKWYSARVEQQPTDF